MRDEADLDLGGVRAVTLEMPGVDEPMRWLPQGHLAPVVLVAFLRALEDPAADVALQHDVQVRLAAGSVVGRPPLADALRPDHEGVLPADSRPRTRGAAARSAP